MSHHDPSLTMEFWRGTALFVSGILLSLFGWLGSRHIKRIDRLEDTAATKKDVETIRKDITAIHERMDDLLLIIQKDNR